MSFWNLIEKIAQFFGGKSSNHKAPSQPTAEDNSPLVSYVALKGAIHSEDERDLETPKHAKEKNISMTRYLNTLEMAFSNPKSQAVFLEIESPGGSAVESALIAEKIQELKAKYNKPVHAFVPRIAASGGFYIACAADYIHVHPQADVGSVGVIGNLGIGLDEVIKKYGLERRLFTSSGSDLKATGDALSPLTQEQRKNIQQMLDDHFNAFRGFVEKSRAGRLNISNENAKTVFRGSSVIGERAVAAGLVDDHQTMDEVLKQFAPGTKYITFKPVIKGKLSLLDELGLKGLATETAQQIGNHIVSGGVEALKQESSPHFTQSSSVYY